MNQLRADRTLQCQKARLKRFHFFVLKVSFLFFLFLTVMPAARISAAGPEDVIINCNIHDGSCSQALADLEITLDITPRPVRAMQDLVFRVLLSGGEPQQAPFIDLGMPGMKMGPNRVILEKASRSFYEGKGVIVRCPSGSRTWRATVTVPGKGKVDFIFDVIN
ncbi:MAG: hypothetical protein AB1427_03315 [Thermodesulfobacteriota bacterium]